MMERYVRIKIFPNGIRVRFERVAGEFDQLREAFYHSIPAAKWSHKERWIVVPLDDMEIVFDFCYHHFGVGHVKIHRSTRVTPTRSQLSMSF